MLSTTLIVLCLALVVKADYDIWETHEGAAYHLGSSGWDDPETPGPVLQSKCALEQNAGYKWEQQAKELATHGQTVGPSGRKRSAWEMFGGDQDAFDHFLRQFHHDEHGRKRSLKMQRYHEETVDGQLVQTLDNWNEPVNLANVASPDVEPQFVVQTSTGPLVYKANAADPSKQVTVNDQTLVDCKMGLQPTDCDSTGVEGPWCCVISRGEVSFIDKVKNCIAAGGSSAVIVNNKEDDLEGALGASLGDDRVGIPVVTLPTAKGREVVAQHLTKKATVGVPPPAGAGYWLPLTSHKNQGSCGDCYLFAAMTSVTMWANLLLWEEKEAAGGKFGPKDQFWMDTEGMTHCYQQMLNSEKNPSKASLDVQFASSGSTPSGDEDTVKKTMAAILRSFRDAPDGTSKLNNLRDYQVQEVNSGDCGYRCYQVEVSISVFRALASGGLQSGGLVQVSTGFNAEVDGTTYSITSVKAQPGAKVCGGGWHHAVLEQWYAEQQLVRVGQAAKAVRFLSIDQTNEKEVESAKYARGPSQKLISQDKCNQVAQPNDHAPILYRFDPFFDEDEASRNPPTRENGVLSTYRPLYMPQSAAPGTVAFADKVRSVLSAAQYGPVMIGVAVCDSMFRVDRSNSVDNPYYDLECTDAINHIVNVIGFKCAGLPAEGASGSASKWWEKCSLLVQNTWGSWGNLGQAWVRVDFTKNWSLGIVPLVRRPGAFKNNYLPSKRLTELRFGKRFSGQSEYNSGRSLTIVNGRSAMRLTRPIMPEVAIKEARATLLVVARSDVTSAPAWLPESVSFACTYNGQKYFEGDVEDQVVAQNVLDESPSGASESGQTVIWTTSTGYSAWEATTTQTRFGEINTFKLDITIDMQPTKLAASKPATYWQSCSLLIKNSSPQGLQSGEDIALEDFYMVIDEKLSAEFRGDSNTQSTSANTFVLSVLVAFVALGMLF